MTRICCTCTKELSEYELHETVHCVEFFRNKIAELTAKIDANDLDEAEGSMQFAMSRIAELETNEKKYKEAIEQFNSRFFVLVNRIIAFASELQSWGNEAAAAEIITEVLGGEVIAPNYNELKEKVAYLEDQLEGYRDLMPYLSTDEEVHALTVELEQKLAEANEDAERLAEPRVDEDKGKLYCRQCGGWGFVDETKLSISHDEDCPVTLHNDRIFPKEGEN